MKQRMYIRAASALSPQQSLGGSSFLHPVLSSNNGKLFAAPADHSKFISPVAIRRMSRALKMAITTAMQCLQESGVDRPDAIVTGTSRGSVTDMQNFVKDIMRLDEEALNPTLFIQSTYNSPNGWIAMQSKCTGYNQTYVHRGNSFEMALLDTQMLLKENPAQNILAGCYDELTDEYFIIKQKIGYWKALLPQNSLDLYQHTATPGSISGEGAAFFLLSAEKSHASTAIVGLRILQQTNANGIAEAIEGVIDDAGISKDDIDLILTGQSGDSRFEEFYHFIRNFRQSIAVAAFKHLVGENDTGAGFGLWLADHLIKTQEIAPEILLSGSSDKLHYILFVNHYLHGSASVFLLCKAE